MGRTLFGDSICLIGTVFLYVLASLLLSVTVLVLIGHLRKAIPESWEVMLVLAMSAFFGIRLLQRIEDAINRGGGHGFTKIGAFGFYTLAAVTILIVGATVLRR